LRKLLWRNNNVCNVSYAFSWVRVAIIGFIYLHALEYFIDFGVVRLIHQRNTRGVKPMVYGMKSIIVSTVPLHVYTLKS
jgi:hypothetical protein